MKKQSSTRSVVKTGGRAKEGPAQSEQAREEEFRRAEISGDRLASRRDAVKARGQRRK